MRIARAAQTVCTLGVCTDYANRPSRQLNTTELDLCDPGNFERFVCDGWRQAHPLGPGQDRVTVQILQQAQVDSAIQPYLDGNDSRSTPRRAATSSRSSRRRTAPAWMSPPSSRPALRR